jgi:SAM-dependent methyltransferase
MSVSSATPATSLAYKDYAYFYNRYWGNSFAAGLFPLLQTYLLPLLEKETATLLDVCCGTGNMVALLNQAGYTTEGLDGSQEMLAFARENNAPGVPFYHQNALKLKLAKPYTAITMCCSSVNNCCYNSHDLLALFTGIRKALKSGGIYCFDVVMEQDLVSEAEQWNALKVQDARHHIVSQAKYDESKKSTSIAIEFKVLNQQRQVEQKQSNITLRAFSEVSLLQTLAKAGFINTRVYRTTEDKRLGRRTLFVAQKP